MNEIMTICDMYGEPVIEDAARSIGTTWHVRNIGTIGNVGCFSFLSCKMLNVGDGGIMVIDRPTRS